MLNKLAAFIREQDLLHPGDHVICALSGGADSVALTFAMYLLKDKLKIQLSAAHFNHHLRGEESHRDEEFVHQFCHRYDIPLFLGGGEIIPGKKGLEAAARDARYTYLRSLPGKIATAHTADDNTETVLMHLVRGTGLKGLGGISPVSGNVIRPMLSVTRQDVEAFLTEWCLPHVEDSSNGTDAFLRNRIRHHVMPLLYQENPRLSENISAMALRLRQDEACLAQQTPETVAVDDLKAMPQAIRSRALEKILKSFGVREPEAEHIALAEALVFSESPSAAGHFPGGITVCRQYDRLVKDEKTGKQRETVLTCPGVTEIPQWKLRVICEYTNEIVNTGNVFTAEPQGSIRIRSRETGDAIRLSGGTKSLKKLFIDRKIPANVRDRIPVVLDDGGILGVYTIGANLDRLAKKLPAIRITIIEI